MEYSTKQRATFNDNKESAKGNRKYFIISCSGHVVHVTLLLIPGLINCNLKAS